ncbi:unnamed protein product [Rhizophagus irregularis]|uniref:Uncharacterized protein n=1 Tax=Rhizophagus irregularis TaxID=588596 RepID=A0A916E636_9GLOM|nr:unnamed protein product [Rhizophagus irregularis]
MIQAFKAANEKNSIILSNALDISGVVGTTCKHGIPMKFLNIKTRERLVYSLFLLNNILDEFGSQINVMYDIGCTMAKHLKVNYL